MDKNILNLIDSVKSLALSSEKQSDTWDQSHLKTGLTYNDFMTKHHCLWTKSDECPERYSVVQDRFKKYGLIEKCKYFEANIASSEQVLLLHDKDYYEIVKSTKDEKDIDKLKRISEKYDGIYFNEYTYDCAMMALGSCINLTDAILDQKTIRNGFALVRTPGHHAQRNEANGFCFFNNAAIVAKHCITNRGLKRILIIDWDVHHGQGTQSFFYDNPNVLYVSIHRYENGKFWPELIESNFNFTGAVEGKGYNFNIPLNVTGCNDADFLLIWFNVILPVAYEFDPELVIISAGFDAAIGCPEGKMRVKPVTYHVLCHSLMALANGKVVALLEGGYNLLSLAESAAMTLRSLIGYPSPKLDENFIEMQPHKAVIETILGVIWATRPQWKMLSLQGSFDRFDPKNSSCPGGDSDMRPKHSPVTTYDGTTMSDKKPEKYDLEGVCCIKNESEQAALNEEILSIIDRQDLSIPINHLEKRTLFIFDDAMTAHKCHSPGHPEKPSRYTSIKKRLQERRLLDKCTIGKSRKATEDELSLAHDVDYIKSMKATASMDKRKLIELGDSMDSIYINQATYDCALLASGCTIEAVDQVMSRKTSNAFALIRPPGHHADKNAASGFCIFNNVVVGAKYALDRYKNICKRVLIFDYDYHHGNGVQKMVYDDERILYISVHGYDDANAYPGEQLSNYTTGSKNIINIPWNDDIMGDSEYLSAFFSIVLPCAYEFNPDLVLISSGFDAAIKDPLGRYKVSPSAYGHFIHHLLPLASGKLIACLEGGYNLDSISEASAHVVAVLLGYSPQSLKLNEPNPASLIAIRNVISYHKSNYKLLCLDYDLPSDEV